MPGFVDDVAVDESIRFIDQASVARESRSHYGCALRCRTWISRHTWPAKQKSSLTDMTSSKMPLPIDLGRRSQLDKPQYLKTARNRTRAIEYGYEDARCNIRKHGRDYYASVEQMDAAVGSTACTKIERRGLNATIPGSSSWATMDGFLGEHGMTSKVLAVRRVHARADGDFWAANNGKRFADELVLNIDLSCNHPTIWLGCQCTNPSFHGRSLLPIVNGAVG